MDGTHRTSRFCVVSFLSVFFFFPYDDDDDNKELNPVGEEASFLSPQFLTGSLIFTGVSLSLSLSFFLYRWRKIMEIYDPSTDSVFVRGGTSLFCIVGFFFFVPRQKRFGRILCFQWKEETLETKDSKRNDGYLVVVFFTEFCETETKLRWNRLGTTVFCFWLSILSIALLPCPRLFKKMSMAMPKRKKNFSITRWARQKKNKMTGVLLGAQICWPEYFLSLTLAHHGVFFVYFLFLEYLFVDRFMGSWRWKETRNRATKRKGHNDFSPANRFHGSDNQNYWVLCFWCHLYMPTRPSSSFLETVFINCCFLPFGLILGIFFPK